MIEILFGVSFLIIILLSWYIIQLLRRFLNFQQELDEFVFKLEEYEGHVDILYNLERFYGDETLGNLLKHSKGIVEDCKQFRMLAWLTDEEDLEEELEEELEEGFDGKKA